MSLSRLLSLSGGNLVERLLRNRGRLRYFLATNLVQRLRIIHDAFMRGDWDPGTGHPKTDCRISMTSWRPRLAELPLVLLTLLLQSVRPSEILVWLTKDDYVAIDGGKKDRFGEFGVRFEICDDLKSHKKWLPMVEKGYRDRFVICDDDIIYPPEWFRALTVEDRPDAYVGCKCHRIRMATKGSIAPYDAWEKQIRTNAQPSHVVFVTGCGGAVVHPERISPEFLNRSAIFKKCPGNDDIWLKAAHLAAGIPCYKTLYSFPCLEIPGTNESGLAAMNVDRGGNDRQIANLREYFSMIEDN